MKCNSNGSLVFSLDCLAYFLAQGTDGKAIPVPAAVSTGSSQRPIPYELAHLPDTSKERSVQRVKQTEPKEERLFGKLVASITSPKSLAFTSDEIAQTADSREMILFGSQFTTLAGLSSRLGKITSPLVVFRLRSRFGFATIRASWLSFLAALTQQGNKARFRARRQRELVSVLKVRGKEDCLGRVQGLNFFSKDIGIGYIILKGIPTRHAIRQTMMVGSAALLLLTEFRFRKISPFALSAAFSPVKDQSIGSLDLEWNRKYEMGSRPRPCFVYLSYRIK
ncbi:hypothetical protein V6N13_057121 [Hibiscus sabdariffa]